MPQQRNGRRHGRDQRLSSDDVRTIRAGYRPGDRISALAERYRTSRVSIIEVLNRRTWNHLEPAPGEYDPPEDTRGTRRVEKKGRAAVTVPATRRPGRTEPGTPAAKPQPRRAAKTRTPARQKKPLHENEVRAIRRVYRPGVRLSQMEDKFGVNSMTIISIVNRCTYNELETGENEYEPPAHIRGTRRREAASAQQLAQQTLPIHRTDTKHLLPEALRAIREAINEGEPIVRIARSFGLAPEAIAHMKQPRSA
ncbi:MAG: hypothetical protein OXG72_13560 [Acidobacteria bacterium]|nr:hypothetical protein [Acidobacteriota bacterium]